MPIVDSIINDNDPADGITFSKTTLNEMGRDARLRRLCAWWLGNDTHRLAMLGYLAQLGRRSDEAEWWCEINRNCNRVDMLNEAERENLLDTLNGLYALFKEKE